jgi:hypothetical protein
VAAFPPGVRWEERFPLPEEFGYPVIAAIDLVERHLSQ